LALLVGVLGHEAVADGERTYAPRFDRSVLVKGKTEDWRQCILAIEEERDLLVSSLIEVSNNEELSIVRRHNAMAEMPRLGSAEAADFLVARVATHTPGLASFRPEQSEADNAAWPARLFLIRMGWFAVGRIREAFVDPRRDLPKDDAMAPLAVVLKATCGLAPARALVVEWLSTPGLPSRAAEQLAKLRLALAGED
jgi:hypothetical protein